MKMKRFLLSRQGSLFLDEGDALCVVCAYNENASELMSTHGIKDECFIRGKAPMTKEEVRTVSLYETWAFGRFCLL